MLRRSILFPSTTALAISLAACSSAPPSAIVAQSHKPLPTASSSSASPPSLSGRWFTTKGYGGNVIVGDAFVMEAHGRRFMLAADKTTRWKTEGPLQPLDKMVTVPTAAGPRLVGVRGGIFYRFEDPLGVGTPIFALQGTVSRLEALPGLVVVWNENPLSRPRFFSIEDGKESNPNTFPDFPLTKVAFADHKHGAAIFNSWGALVTNDGGTTWKRPKAEAQAAGALDVVNFDRIDILGGRLAKEPVAQKDNDRFNTFWHFLERGPLVMATLTGVVAPDGSVWMGWANHVMRIDLNTLNETEVIASIPGTTKVPWCDLLRAGSDVWIGCKMSPGASLDNVVHATFKDRTLQIGSPETIDLEATDLRSSPSGGILAFGRAKTKTPNTTPPINTPPAVSVRQPNGAWTFYSINAPAMEQSAGALVDGRIVYLENPDPNKGQPRVVVVNPLTGAKDELPALAEPIKSISSPIEEDAAHVLHFVAEDAQGFFAVALPLNGKPPTVVRLPKVFAARMQGGRGVALTTEHVLVSTDSGLTWNEVPTPPELRDILSNGPKSTFVEGNGSRVWNLRVTPPTADHANKIDFAVSDVGFQIGKFLRMGWDVAAPLPTLPQGPPEGLPQVPAPLASITSLPARNTHTLSCQDGGTSSQAWSPKGPTWAEFVQREMPFVVANYPRVKMIGQELPNPNVDPLPLTLGGTPLATRAVFVEEGNQVDDLPSKLPEWAIGWLDPTEIGSKARVWKGKSPNFLSAATSAWGTVANPNDPQPIPLAQPSLSGLAARDGRAIFYIAGSFNQPDGNVDAGTLVRVSANGTREVAKVLIGNTAIPTATFARPDAFPPGLVKDTWILDDRLYEGKTALLAASFGRGPGAPIAGILGHQLFVWFEGKQFQPIVHLPTQEFPGQIVVGEPTADGVPLLILRGSFQRIGVVPFPKTIPQGEYTPPLPDDIQWKSLPVAIDPTRLPICDAKMKGMAFSLTVVEPTMRTVFLTYEVVTARARFFIRVNDERACVAHISVAFDPTGTTNTCFLRADLEGKRAEGAAMDASHGDVRKMVCTWTEDKKK